MPPEGTHGFTATLSDGSTVAEHHGEWKIIAGERKPFVRLCDYLLLNKLYLTSLRYNANGTTYHAPKLDTRWNKGGLQPTGYSIEYIAELEPDEGIERHFVDMGALYGGLSVHTIFELGGQAHVYTQARSGFKPMAEAVASDIWSAEK